MKRYSFDAWGKRREVDWQPYLAGIGTIWQGERMTRGYTGHEQLDPVGLVHPGLHRGKHERPRSCRRRASKRAIPRSGGSCRLTRSSIAEAAGGTASVLAGGKSADGAVTGAMGHLFNAEGIGKALGRHIAGGMEQARRTIGQFVQSVYRNIIPGYALAECVAYGGCTRTECATTVASSIPGFKFPSSAGNVVSRVIGTAIGEVQVIGTVDARGTILVVDDLVVWPADGQLYSGGLGNAAAVMRAAKPLFDDARSHGFTRIEFSAVKITGANPGHTLTGTIDLTE